jgi:hypothetical protein
LQDNCRALNIREIKRDPRKEGDQTKTLLKVNKTKVRRRLENIKHL